MTTTVLFAAGAKLFGVYAPHLQTALAEAGVDADVVTAADPASVDYLVIVPGGEITDFTPFTRAKAVLNLWAGVERIVGNPTLTQPLCRMVDPAMTESMVEYVTANVLRHHLELDRHILCPPGAWAPFEVPIARERPVTILGFGELGQACGRALTALNFPVTGWSRGPRDVPGMTCLHGAEGLEAALSRAQILITLMPLTAQTQNLLDAARLAQLPRGAVIINPGRGGLIDDAALLAALDSGHVAHATLDVFRVEPLPADHPYWAHPRVTVTPHVAAQTRAATASRVVAENIRRGEAGLPFLHLVDRARGY